MGSLYPTAAVRPQKKLPFGMTWLYARMSFSIFLRSVRARAYGLLSRSAASSSLGVKSLRRRTL